MTRRSTRRGVVRPGARTESPVVSETCHLPASAYVERQERYAALIRSVQSLSSLERAEAWLRYVANDWNDVGDEEALIYLRSRGHDCAGEIEHLIAHWRSAERRSLERALTATSVGGFHNGDVKAIGTLSDEEASRLSPLSPSIIVPDFWQHGPRADVMLDFTMLRAVEWCDIGGFDDWWRRMANDRHHELLLGGLEPHSAAVWLFCGCRSSFARRRLRRTLDRMLEAMELSSGGTDPWLRFPLATCTATPLTHVAHASTLIVASNTVREVQDRDANLILRAAETLVREQRPDGSWPLWVDADARSSVLATAMAVHALVQTSGHGHARAAETACAWLHSVQHEEGYWSEQEIADPVFLTVLVLDALELGRGGTSATIRDPGSATLGCASNTTPRQRRRFDVALSFPGELRPRVARIAQHLASRLGRDRVFYDNSYTSELARPNLDTHLQQIYHDDSELVVVFLCADYARKDWCGLEWRAVRDIIKRRDDEKIMFIRGDDATVPGIFSLDGYVDLRSYRDDGLADLVLARLGGISRADLRH